MYRYQPPKSNVWGHSLRKMPVMQVRSRLAEFLTKATMKHEFQSASLMIIDTTAGRVHKYESLLGTPAQNDYFANLTPEQFENCLNTISMDRAETILFPNPVLLSQAIMITQWNMTGTSVATESVLMVHYGERPCISTFLLFDTIEQFQYVKSVLEDVSLCKLNEKHLKPVKAKSARNRTV